MAFPLLIPLGIAIGALIIAAREKKAEPKKELPPPHTPPLEQNMLMALPDGSIGYKPEARPIMLGALKVKTIEPTNNDHYFWLDDYSYNGAFPDPGKSAWWLAKNVHALGKNIWVVPTLLDPTPQRRQLLWTDQGQSPPKSANLALLLSFKDPWPGGEQP